MKTWTALLLLSLASTRTSLAWIAPLSLTNSATRSTKNTRQASTSGVDTIKLDGLGDDHEKVGAAMALSVQRWLDAEWMPQEIHAQIGASCAESYVKCRLEKRTDDIMNIMTAVADDLTEVWYEKYDAEAFVNQWDIANYVSDYLVKQSGNESCECSADIH